MTDREPEPEFSNWKDAWEWQATETHRAFLDWPPTQLLAAADAGRYDAYTTLFGLLGEPDEPLPELRQRVMWDRGDEAGRQRALDELDGVIAGRLAASSRDG